MEGGWRTPAGEDVRELLSSHIAATAELVVRRPELLPAVVELFGDKNPDMRVRALLVVQDVLRRADDAFKLEIFKRAFNPLLGVLASKEPRVVVKGLKILSALIEDIPLNRGEFTSLVDVLVDLIEEGDVEFSRLEIFDLITKMTAAHPSGLIRSKIMWLLSHDDELLRAMGLRLLLNVFVSTGDPKTLVLLFEESLDMLPEDDLTFVDFTLGILEKALGWKSPEEAIPVLPRVLSKLESLSENTDDFLVKIRVKRLSERIEEVLVRYYASRPDEAKKFLTKLALDGEHDIAMNLALAMGDEFLLKWMERFDAERSDFGSKPEFVSEPRRRPGKAVSYPIPHETRRARDNAEAGTVEDTAVDRDELKRAIEEGDVDYVVKALLTGRGIPEVMGQFLASSDPELRGDVLWILSNVASRVPAERLSMLSPPVDVLFDILMTGNPWERDRAAKILANISAKCGRNEIAERIAAMGENPLSVLTFFGYYFLYARGEGFFKKVFPVIKLGLAEPELQFYALATLESLFFWGIPEGLDVGEVKALIEPLATSPDEDTKKAAKRVLKMLRGVKSS